MLTAANPDLTELRVRAGVDPSSVTESDYVRLFMDARILFRRFATCDSRQPPRRAQLDI